MYDTVEEARQKLEGSVVMFDGVPVFIHGVAGNKNNVRLYFKLLPLGKTSKEDVIGIDDPRWDFKNLGAKLGFVNMYDKKSKVWSSVFTSRIPVRHSRQGLDSRTVNIKHLPVECGFPCDWDYFPPSEGLVHTMTNAYPTCKEIFDRLMVESEQVIAGAFTRKLALIYDKVTPPVLIYRGDKIGYSEDGELFKLAKHKQYLKEELEDMEGLKIA